MEVFNRVVVLTVGLAMVAFGIQNFMNDLGSFRAPSLIPLATYTASVPIAGALIALVLRRATDQRLEPRFRGTGRSRQFRGNCAMSNGSILLLMTALFLIFGYMGVPVAFALMAGVLAACALTPISMQSMIGQMFHGIDSEILLAVPFFLLVGELMTSANVTNRMIRLAQTMVVTCAVASRRLSPCSACSLPVSPAHPPRMSQS